MSKKYPTNFQLVKLLREINTDAEDAVEVVLKVSTNELGTWQVNIVHEAYVWDEQCFYARAKLPGWGLRFPAKDLAKQLIRETKAAEKTWKQSNK